MKNDCKYYDQMLGTENLNELVHASSDCELVIVDNRTNKPSES